MVVHTDYSRYRDVLTHGTNGPGPRVLDSMGGLVWFSSRPYYDNDSNNFNGQVFFPVTFSEKKGRAAVTSVKVSDHGRHVMSSSSVPLKTRHVGSDAR
ncbi:hypothetical protein TNCV_1757871 [Trichonephila clavipes]|nr:hypothetical protein TNCV_1757871 [Trichonephila clavipes]